MNQAAKVNIGNGENGTWTCGECGVRSASIACFCWNCGAAEKNRKSRSPVVPMKINPGEPAYVFSKELNIRPPRANDISYVRVDTVRSKAPAPTTGELKLFDLLPRSAVAGTMEHDGAFQDVSDGASTTVSDYESSNRSESLDSGSGPEQEMTTLMVCPLPYEVSSDELLQAINTLGYAGTYDFVYMPSRSTRKGAKSRKGNVGYAFVNFGKSERATQFAAAFEGYSFPDVEEAERPIAVKPAACQGYTANFAMYLANKKKKQGDFMAFPMTDSV